MTAALTVLRHARALISTPEKWIQRAYACDGEGIECAPTHKRAACWCALGAISNAMETIEPRHSYEVYGEIRKVLARFADTALVCRWNDTPGRTHAEVLDAFDRAIASLEAA